MASGRWPDSLDDLVPEFLDGLPVDPFTGKGLRYSVTEDTAVVFSVGPDGADHGGITYGEAQRAWDADGRLGEIGGWDVSFRLLRPELRGSRRRTFREEISEHEIGRWGLEEGGYTPERLRDLGFTDEDLESLGFER